MDNFHFINYDNFVQSAYQIPLRFIYCGDRVQTVTIFGLLHFLGDFKMPLFSDGCDYLSENVFSQIEGILN